MSIKVTFPPKAFVIPPIKFNIINIKIILFYINILPPHIAELL